VALTVSRDKFGLFCTWQEDVISKAKQASVELLKRAGIRLETRMNIM